MRFDRAIPDAVNYLKKELITILRHEDHNTTVQIDIRATVDKIKKLWIILLQK